MPKGSRKSAERRSFAEHIQFAVLWFFRSAVIGIVLWAIIWLTRGDAAPYFGFIHAGGWLYGLFMLVAGGYFLARRQWPWAVVSMLLSLWLMATPMGVNWAASEERSAAADIRVLSASLGGFNRDMSGAAKHLNQFAPAVIGLQEVTDAAQFTRALEEVSGGKWYSQKRGNLAFVSRYRFTILPDSTTNILKARFDKDGRSVVIWTLRAPKNFARPLINRQFYNDLGQAIVAAKPDIVMGDFNSSPWNEGYEIMAKVMTNAHKTAGFGPGNSFPAPGRRSGALGAIARIDHIFVSPESKAHNAFTAKASPGADHYPVIADVQTDPQG